MNKIARNSQFIKSKAFELGFSFVGISKAKRLDGDAKNLENWLNKNYHASMHYMENHFEKRVDPTKLVEGSKSVISLLYNYHTDEKIGLSNYKISKYAYGKDYHEVIRKKLNYFLEAIKTEIGDVQGRGFVDSAPVLDRAWARESGIGWIGKNGMLITRQHGSEFFLAELIIDLELEYDGPIKDYCGTCTKCIDECPTNAILPNKELDSNRCISYLTIELRDNEIPNEFKGRMDDWVFGCDICQDVCPWNRFAKSHSEENFLPNALLKGLDDHELENLNEDSYKEIFKKSPIKRTKYSGLKRNIDFVKK